MTCKIDIQGQVMTSALFKSDTLDHKQSIDANIPFKSHLFGIYSWPVEAMRMCKIQTLSPVTKRFQQQLIVKQTGMDVIFVCWVKNAQVSVALSHTYIYNSISGAKLQFVCLQPQAKFVCPSNHMIIRYWQFYSNTFFKIHECWMTFGTKPIQPISIRIVEYNCFQILQCTAKCTVICARLTQHCKRYIQYMHIHH